MKRLSNHLLIPLGALFNKNINRLYHIVAKELEQSNASHILILPILGSTLSSIVARTG